MLQYKDEWIHVYISVSVLKSFDQLDSILMIGISSWSNFYFSSVVKIMLSLHSHKIISCANFYLLLEYLDPTLPAALNVFQHWNNLYDGILTNIYYSWYNREISLQTLKGPYDCVYRTSLEGYKDQLRLHKTCCKRCLHHVPMENLQLYCSANCTVTVL